MKFTVRLLLFVALGLLVPSCNTSVFSLDGGRQTAETPGVPTYLVDVERDYMDEGGSVISGTLHTTPGAQFKLCIVAWKERQPYEPYACDSKEGYQNTKFHGTAVAAKQVRPAPEIDFELELSSKEPDKIYVGFVDDDCPPLHSRLQPFNYYLGDGPEVLFMRFHGAEKEPLFCT